MTSRYLLQLTLSILFCISITSLSYGQKQNEIWDLEPKIIKSRSLVEEADELYFSNQYQKAASLYEQIVELNPDDITSLYNLSLSYHFTGNYEKAIINHIKVSEYMESDRTDGKRHYKRDALFNLACAYSQTGQIEKSYSALGNAIEEGFDNFRDIQQDDDLVNLRADEHYGEFIKKLRMSTFSTDSINTTEPSPKQIVEGVKIAVKLIKERHPNPYRHFSEEEWDKKAAGIINRANDLTETEYLVEMMGLLGMAGDVHTSVFPRGDNLLQDSYGLRFWKFSDGLYIRAATKELSYLVGARVVAVNDVKIEEAWDTLIDKFPTENQWMSTYMSQFYMQFPALLHVLKLSETPEGGSWTFELRDGSSKHVYLTANEHVGYSKAMSTSLAINKLPEGWVSTHEQPEENPLWLQNENENYWYKVIENETAVFFQMNVPRYNKDKPWDAFLDDMFDEIEKNDKIERLIVDLRHHEGGWHYMAKDLVRKILQSEKIDKPGALYILSGRITQSAGLAFIAWPEMDTYPIIVGEPAGAHPNLYNGAWGNHRPVQLPGTGITLRISTHIQQFSDAIDDRHIIAPDLPATMTYKQYKMGEDPALTQALNFPVDKGHLFFEDAGGRQIPRYLPWRRLSQKNAFEKKKKPF